MTTRATTSPAPKAAHHIPKVGMISLGCAKNLVDAEIMLGDVLAHGMQITNDADQADVLIVNTCAFIDSAKEESIEAIIEAHEAKGLKKKHKNQKLIVAGCMSQRFSGELAVEFKSDVDAFIGLDQVKDIGGIIERVLGRGAEKSAQSSVLSAQCSEKRTATSHQSPVTSHSGESRRAPARRMAAAQPRLAQTRLHSRLGHAARPAHAAAHGVHKNRRGVQSPVQLLRHPADARTPPVAFG